MTLLAFDAIKTSYLQWLSLFDYIVSHPLIYCNTVAMFII